MKIRFLPALSLAGLAGGLLLSSCAQKADEPTPTPPSTLYDRIGQTNGVAKLTDNLLANVAAETATPNSVLLRVHQPLLDAVNGVNGAAPTDPTRLQRLRSNFINQIGAATGGPLVYTGKSMLAAHAGMAITNVEYNVWFSEWEKSVSASNVASQDHTDLNAIINNMRNDVVGH